MKGILYQFKNIRRDKMCLITFLLPLLFGLGVQALTGTDLAASIAAPSFGFVAGTLTQEADAWLRACGSVKAFADDDALAEGVLNPSTQLIGIRQAEDGGLSPLLAGDELTVTVQTARALPQLFRQRDALASVAVTAMPAPERGDALRSLLCAITLVTAMFMGCTFNAMSVIGEKEDGVDQVLAVLPMSRADYLAQKMTVGFVAGSVSALLTALICMRVPGAAWLFLIPLIALSAFLAALTGMFVSRLAAGLMTGIVWLKAVMLLYIAPPIVFYLFMPADGALRLLTCLLPSSAALYGLMDMQSGNLERLPLHLLLLAAHCYVWFLLYLRLAPGQAARVTAS